MKTGTKVTGLVMVAFLAMAANTALAKPSPKKELTGQVNLNTATTAQLDLLPGIGKKAADRIVDFRKKTPFAKIDDLRKVKGFGAKKMEKLRPFLTVSGATTVAVRKLKAGEVPSKATPSAQGRKSTAPPR